MTELTQKEKRIYEYIESTIENEGYAPTVRDICAALGIKSTSTAHLYLRRLDEKGYIKKYDGKSRAVSLERSKFGDKEKTLRVPLLGKVTAGMPITAVQNYEGYVDFPVSMARNSSNLFALRVYGESMKDAGILDGDIVVVEGRQYADNGEIVVAMIDDEATVKRFYREKDRVRLQPENSAMKPIYSKDVMVLGKVIANFRFY
ncbi:MAG: transcriptional repressor LexA [Clostridiales bacterium]|jgi:repressor LexA|nr:transcriptional repressor LexA [Clostridiales bacterium]